MARTRAGPGQESGWRRHAAGLLDRLSFIRVTRSTCFWSHMAKPAGSREYPLA